MVAASCMSMALRTSWSSVLDLAPSSSPSLGAGRVNGKGLSGGLALAGDACQGIACASVGGLLLGLQGAGQCGIAHGLALLSLLRPLLLDEGQVVGGSGSRKEGIRP